MLNFLSLRDVCRNMRNVINNALHDRFRMEDTSCRVRLRLSFLQPSVLQTNFWELISGGITLANVVLVILILFSIYSWTIIFAKWSAFSSARKSDSRFLRGFPEGNRSRSR